MLESTSRQARGRQRRCQRYGRGAV